MNTTAALTSSGSKEIICAASAEDASLDRRTVGIRPMRRTRFEKN